MCVCVCILSYACIPVFLSVSPCVSVCESLCLTFIVYIKEVPHIHSVFKWPPQRCCMFLPPHHLPVAAVSEDVTGVAFSSVGVCESIINLLLSATWPLAAINVRPPRLHLGLSTLSSSAPTHSLSEASACGNCFANLFAHRRHLIFQRYRCYRHILRPTCLCVCVCACVHWPGH